MVFYYTILYGPVVKNIAFAVVCLTAAAAATLPRKPTHTRWPATAAAAAVEVSAVDTSVNVLL